ncbi:DNA packaging protein [Psittacid alphaherpesvirus 5]|nr:DNA packaging protein [Psittacid alphaherpesvirus 5]
MTSEQSPGESTRSYIRSICLSRDEINNGWKLGALDRVYRGYDPSLLKLNDRLANEILYASHLIGVLNTHHERSSQCPLNVDEEINDLRDVEPFINQISTTFSIDYSCRVCATIDTYKKECGLCPEWISDYALLCYKSLATPLCASSTYITTFEFIFIMDKHYLRQHGITLVGSIARHVLTLGDIKRHFYLNCCFKTVRGGLSIRIGLNNYSFLVHSVAQLSLTTFTQEQSIVSSSDTKTRILQYPNTHGTTVALLKWRDYAQAIDCFADERSSNSRTKPISCVNKARYIDEQRNTEFERVNATSPNNSCDLDNHKHTISPATWAYVDLTLLLLAGTTNLPIHVESSHPLHSIKTLRKTTVETFHDVDLRILRNDISPNMRQFSTHDSKPETDVGPVLTSILPHTITRGGTGGECLLCNMMLTESYWNALCKLHTRAMQQCNSNVSLFDGIELALQEWDSILTVDDNGRSSNILKAVGSNGVYKHFFCDPMCAANTIRVDSEKLWHNPPRDTLSAELFKAELAMANIFEERVCPGLWLLAFTFKAYQIAPPRTTTLNSFIRDAERYLRKHNLPRIALEHALTKYV